MTSYQKRGEIANNPIEMSQLRTVLRLFKELKMDPEELEAIDDKALSELFTPTVRERNNPKLQPLLKFFP